MLLGCACQQALSFQITISDQVNGKLKQGASLQKETG
jgi:hypothetical protein